MKKLSFLNKLVFFLNNFFAIALIISFVIPNLQPKTFGVFSLISLFTPALILINLVFILYWIISGFKKQVILSILVLVLSYFFLPTIYAFNIKSNIDTRRSLKVMSFNVRKFNVYKWLNDKNLITKIDSFIVSEDPDLLAIQEYRAEKRFNINYQYSYIDLNVAKMPTGLAIFSKYPIINKGFIAHKPNNTDAIYIDFIKNNDTVRFYNFRMASLRMDPDKSYLGHKDSEKLLKRTRNSFKLQQDQIELLNSSVKKNKYKVILAGDMNNTAYSWAYKNIKNNFQDSFIEAGNGFGRTYEFKKFPLRIDYIFVDQKIKILNHKSFDQKYSDHYPLIAELEF
jgi:exonuclease III